MHSAEGPPAEDVPNGRGLEAILKSARPAWSSKTVQTVVEKLATIGIKSGPALVQALRNKATNDLNRRLRAAGQRGFTVDTLQALSEHAARSDEERASKLQSPCSGSTSLASTAETRSMPVFFRQGLQERPGSEAGPEEKPKAELPSTELSDEDREEEAANLMGKEAFYLVDNSLLQATVEGLGPRLSKRMSDKDECSCIPWGTRVCGCDEGDGWLRVDNWYLPMSVNGVPVIVEDHSIVRVRVCGLAGELCQVDVDRSWVTRDLQREIEKHTNIPWREQQLFTASAHLHEADQLEALPAGKTADITLVRVDRSPEQVLWLERVEADGLQLRKAPPCFRRDCAVVCSAVRQNGLALEFASPELCADRSVVWAALCCDGAALDFASESLQADPELCELARSTREYWLRQVQANGMELGKAPSSYRADKEFALAAVQQTGWALQFVTAGLKADRETVIAAVKVRGRALRHAAAHLLSDKEVVLAAVQASGHALELAAEELKADKDVVLAAVRQDGSALAYADEMLRADREVVMAAIHQDSAAVALAGSLWSDAEVRSAVAQQHGAAVSFHGLPAGAHLSRAS